LTNFVIDDAAIDLIEEDINTTILGLSEFAGDSSDEDTRVSRASRLRSVRGAPAKPNGAATSSLAFQENYEV